jgi:glycosyltransferase involved in cell wall biosynthesis
MVFVDDGSTDGSTDELAEIAASDSRVTVIIFRRNMGKAHALAAGFRRAQGDVMVTIDADLQDDPEEIPALLQKLEEGFDLVSGWKYPRLDPWYKVVPSKLVNRLTNAIGGTALHDMNCGLKAYRRVVVNTVRLYGELHRFVPLLAHQYGFKVAEMKIRHHPRKFGRSKYDVGKQFAGSLDLLTVMFLTRFNRKPFHLLGGAGMVCFGGGAAILLYLCWIKIVLGQLIGHRPLLLLGVLLMLVSVQLVFFGLLAEMMNYFNPVEDRDYIRTVLTHHSRTGGVTHPDGEVATVDESERRSCGEITFDD